MPAHNEGAARTRPPPFRKNITHGEIQAAINDHEGLRRCRAQYKYFGPKLNPLKAYKRQSDFMARYRFPKAIVRQIAADFGRSPFFDKKTNPNVDGRDNFCNAEYVTCLGLRYLATGAPYTVLADLQGRAVKSTVCKNINMFIDYLAVKSAENVRFPETREELMEKEAKFQERYGLAGCVACNDGTYIPMLRPTVNEAAFFCRKHYHALNVMIICDADQKILAIEAGFGGSHQDSTVWENSLIGRRIRNEKLLKEYYILGDNGYQLSEEIIVPFRRAELEGQNYSEARARFQETVTGARSCIEQCNAQLKGRWRILSKYGAGVLQRSPTNTAIIVKACAYLHNLAIECGLAKITRESQADPDLEPQIRRNAMTYLLNAVKRNANRVCKARYRPSVNSVYLRGVAKRNQILREQFGDRSVRIGPPKPPTGARRPVGRPRGSLGRLTSRVSGRGQRYTNV